MSSEECNEMIETMLTQLAMTLPLLKDDKKDEALASACLNDSSL